MLDVFLLAAFVAILLDQRRTVINLRRRADCKIDVTRIDRALFDLARTHFDILDRIVAI